MGEFFCFAIVGVRGEKDESVYSVEILGNG